MQGWCQPPKVCATAAAQYLRQVLEGALLADSVLRKVVNAVVLMRRVGLLVGQLTIDSS